MIFAGCTHYNYFLEDKIHSMFATQLWTKSKQTIFAGIKYTLIEEEGMYHFHQRSRPDPWSGPSPHHSLCGLTQNMCRVQVYCNKILNLPMCLYHGRFPHCYCSTEFVPFNNPFALEEFRQDGKSYNIAQ